jgi:serine/threonine protein kinase
VSGNFVPGQAGLVPGARIGSYRLEERVGRGGMAVVFRAREERRNRIVALKVLAPGMTKDAGFRKRFLREPRAATAVNHPNILPVYDAGEAEGYLFIAMRYVRGGDVRGLLRQSGRLPVEQAWRIVSQMASALDAAHGAGLVHRDVKPANMLLESAADIPRRHQNRRPDDHSEHVYLTDFGVSKQVLAEQLTATGQIVGTLDYISPEQIEGRDVDGRTDLYSLACTTFELLAGVPPFRRDQGPAIIYAQLAQAPPSLVARRPELPPAVDRVLARALAKKQPERQANCSQFAAHLGWALELLGGRAAPAGQPAPESGSPHLAATRLAQVSKPPAPPPAEPGAARRHRGPPTEVVRSPDVVPRSSGQGADPGAAAADPAVQPDPAAQPGATPDAPPRPAGPEPPTTKRHP